MRIVLTFITSQTLPTRSTVHRLILSLTTAKLRIQGELSFPLSQLSVFLIIHRVKNSYKFGLTDASVVGTVNKS